MHDSESLMIERNEIQERLATTGRSVEEHLKTDHKNGVSSTCHKCINFAFAIRVEKENLNNIDKKLQK